MEGGLTENVKLHVQHEREGAEGVEGHHKTSQRRDLHLPCHVVSSQIRDRSRGGVVMIYDAMPNRQEPEPPRTKKELAACERKRAGDPVPRSMLGRFRGGGDADGAKN